MSAMVNLHILHVQDSESLKALGYSDSEVSEMMPNYETEIDPVDYMVDYEELPVMATKQERFQEKLDALKTVVDSYVRLVYRYPDGEAQELFGVIYNDHRGLTLTGGWIDIELLERIERRETGIETVFNTEPATRLLVGHSGNYQRKAS